MISYTSPLLLLIPAAFVAISGVVLALTERAR